MTQVTKPLTVVETDGIRRFDNAQIQKAIDRALAAKAADRKVAVVAHADLEGVSLSFVTRLPKKGWSISVGAYKPYQGPLAAEAEVVWSPF